MSKLKRFMLQNSNAMQVELCNFGARILSIRVPNDLGELIETTLNHATDEAIVNDGFYMGATVGRTSNRISNSRFSLDGVEHHICTNDGIHNLHGGENGFSKRMWQTDGANNTGNAITFTLRSEDGDQGFPGEVNAQIIFTLNESNELKFDFLATSTKPTPINLCNHAYFTMGEDNIDNLELCIQGDAYLPVNADSLPLGHFEAVANTRFDFNSPATLAERLTSGTFDHCYRTTSTKMARLKSQKHKICLEIESDHVGIQFYSGNFLPIPQAALCLEAQGYPDAINHSVLAPDILRPGKEYRRYVIYRYMNK